MYRIAILLVLLSGLVACGLQPEKTNGQRVGQLNARATKLHDQARYIAARDAWQQALKIVQNKDLAPEEGEILLKLSQTNEKLGDYQRASTLAWQAVRNPLSTNDPAFRIQALVAAGMAARRLGEYQEAQTAYAQALDLAEREHDTQQQAEALCGLGATLQAKSDYPGALDFYKRSLALAIGGNNLMIQAKCLNNLGGLYRLTGDYHKALKHYRQSLALRKRLHDISGEAKVLGNICLVYQNLGDPVQAEAHCRQSLSLAKQTGDRGREANNLNNLAAIYEARRNHHKALILYKKSLKLKQAIADRAGEARTLNNIGHIYLRMGNSRKALDYYGRSLTIKEQLGDLSGQSASLQNLAVLQLQLGRYDKARAHFEQALILQQEIGQPEVLWRSYDGLSRVHEKLGKDALAIYFGKQAINTIQSMRSRILALERKLRRSFLEDKIQIYKRLASLLVDAGRLWEAQQVLALLKQEEYFEYVRGQETSTAGATSLNASENDWQARYDQIIEELTTIRRDYTELKRKQRKSGLTTAESNELKVLKEKLGDIRLAHHQYILDLQTAFTQSQRLDEFRGDNLRRLEKFQRVLKNLGEGTVLIHYFVTEDQLKIIVSGPQSSIPPVWKHSNISKKELNRKIAALRKALLNPRQDPLPPAQALHAVLFAPIEKLLTDFNARTLMVYLDDALRYLPLGALHDGHHYLAENFGISIYTAAADTDLAQRTSPRWRVAGLGVSKAFEAKGFPPLPAAREELDAIIKEDSSDQKGILPGVSYMDDAFTPTRLEEVLSEDCLEEDCYNVVHLATHYLFKPGSWSDSFLLAGNQTLLSLEDLQRGDYYFGNLDLLTLSACETALWSDDARGREIEGLGTLAQNKGAKAVMATLWEVADCSTAIFMEQFYKHKQEGGNTKIEALQKTQMAFIKGTISDTALPECVSRGISMVSETEDAIDTNNTTAPFSHPYYWAPFVLMGNWQ